MVSFIGSTFVIDLVDSWRSDGDTKKLHNFDKLLHQSQKLLDNWYCAELSGYKNVYIQVAL